MGRASRGKLERKIQALLHPLSHINPVTRPPWYETNLLWVPLTTALGIILFVWAAMMRGDFRFLLWLALALSIHPSWIFSKNIGIKRVSFQKVSFLVLLLLSVLGTYGFYSYLAEEPIAVSPSEEKLTYLFDTQKRMRGHIDFSVYNRSDDPYYGIWVKILIDSKLLSAEGIDLDFPTIEERVRTGDREIAISSGCLRGRNKDSRAAFLCIVDALSPKGEFKIQMTTTHAWSDMPEEQIGIASMKIVTFSKQPSRHFVNFPGKTSGASSEHTIPEKFTSTTMIYFCPDIGEPFKSLSPITCTPNSKYRMEKK